MTHIQRRLNIVKHHTPHIYIYIYINMLSNARCLLEDYVVVLFYCDTFGRQITTILMSLQL